MKRINGLCSVFAAILILSGCELGQQTEDLLPKPKPRSVTFSSGISIKGPDGYCAASHLTRETGANGFAVFAPCLSGDTPDRVVTIATRPVAEKDQLDDQKIKAALEKDPKIRKVSVVDTMQMAHIVDKKPTAALGMQPDFWRMMTQRGDLLLVANYYGHTQADATEANAQRVFTNLIEKLPNAHKLSTQPAPEILKTVTYLPTVPMLKPVYRP